MFCSVVMPFRPCDNYCLFLSFFPRSPFPDDEEHAPAGMLSRMRSAFIPGGGGGEGGGHDSHGGGRSSIRNKPNVSNKFSASVKQAWKTKKIVSKMRRRSVSQPVGQSRLAARRTSVMGLGLPGLGFGGGGGHHHGGGGGKSWAAGGADAGTGLKWSQKFARLFSYFKSLFMLFRNFRRFRAGRYGR